MGVVVVVIARFYLCRVDADIGLYLWSYGFRADWAGAACLTRYYTESNY